MKPSFFGTMQYWAKNSLENISMGSDRILHYMYIVVVLYIVKD